MLVYKTFKEENMNYYENIKEELISNEVYYSKNRSD